MTVPDPLIQYANRQPFRARRGTPFAFQTPAMQPHGLRELPCEICVEPTLGYSPCLTQLKANLQRSLDWPELIYFDIVSKTGFFTISTSFTLPFINVALWRKDPLEYTVLSTTPGKHNGLPLGTVCNAVFLVLCGCSRYDLGIEVGTDRTATGGSLGHVQRAFYNGQVGGGCVTANWACYTPSTFSPCAPISDIGELRLEFVGDYAYIIDRTTKLIDTMMRVKWDDPSSGQHGSVVFHIHE